MTGIWTWLAMSISYNDNLDATHKWECLTMNKIWITWLFITFWSKTLACRKYKQNWFQITIFVISFWLKRIFLCYYSPFTPLNRALETISSSQKSKSSLVIATWKQLRICNGLCRKQCQLKSFSLLFLCEGTKMTQPCCLGAVEYAERYLCACMYTHSHTYICVFFSHWWREREY